MPLYLSILEGPDPFEATPVMSSSDPLLIAAFAELIAARLGAKVPGHILDVRHVTDEPGHEGDDG